jgi:hypothetical protein
MSKLLKARRTVVDTDVVDTPVRSSHFWSLASFESSESPGN